MATYWTLRGFWFLLLFRWHTHTHTHTHTLSLSISSFPVPQHIKEVFGLSQIQSQTLPENSSLVRAPHTSHSHTFIHHSLQTSHDTAIHPTSMLLVATPYLGCMRCMVKCTPNKGLQQTCELFSPLIIELLSTKPHPSLSLELAFEISVSRQQVTNTNTPSYIIHCRHHMAQPYIHHPHNTPHSHHNTAHTHTHTFTHMHITAMQPL